MHDSTSEWLSSFKSRKVLREVRQKEYQQGSADRPALTISITGGKGGVGKTSVSIKFAKLLADQGKKVLLIDCDSNLSNTAIKLGLPIRDDFYTLMSANKPFEECIYKDKNFHLLSACNGNLDMFDSSFALDQAIIDIICEQEKEYDYILLDCPAGLSRHILNLSAYCDHRVIVVTPDKSSITDSYSLVKVLKTKFGTTSNHLLVNKVSNKNQFKKVVKTLSETIENFLGCRTHIIGGIAKISTSNCSFDSHLVKGENSILHQNFVKVLGNFTEKIDNQLVQNFSRRSFEQQEVH
jgi:flagellar biosynthesis protein FlhG